MLWDKRCEWEDPGLMEKLPSGTVTFLFTDRPSYGLVKLNPPPGSDRPPYRADGLTGELDEMLAQEWTRVEKLQGAGRRA